MLNKIRDHPTHTALAIGMVAFGLFLMLNDHYFIWPPQASGGLNDDVVGFLFCLDGMGIAHWVTTKTPTAKQNRNLLAFTSFLMAFLTAVQFLTWVATGIYTSWISNLLITAFVLILARRSDTRDD